MKHIPSPIAREVEITVPAFVKAVNAKSGSYIITTLDAFINEPELLYKCIWYANSHDKAVRFLTSLESLDRTPREATVVDENA